jgi:hypothetical protein
MAYRTEKHRRELQQLPPKGFLGICQVCAWHHTLLDGGVQVDSTPNSLDCITLTGESCCALYSRHRAALSSEGTQQLGSEDMLLLSSLRCARDKHNVSDATSSGQKSIGHFWVRGVDREVICVSNF